LIEPPPIIVFELSLHGAHGAASPPVLSTLEFRWAQNSQTKVMGQSEVLQFETFIGMAEKCSCIFYMFAIHGGPIR
jgi:hypothetical protein